MTDDPGNEIRERFRTTQLPPAPVHLHERLGAVSSSRAATAPSRIGRARLVVALAAAVAVASIGLLVGGGADEPSPNPNDGARWGPLAVADLIGAEAALMHGELLFTDQCAFLVEGDGTRVLLVWPSARTTWDADSRMVLLKHPQTNDVVALRESVPLALGGGGSSVSEDGLSGEAWATRFDWVAPPAPECLTDERWVVSDAVPPVAEATPEPPPYEIVCQEAEPPAFTCAEVVDATLAALGSDGLPIAQIDVGRLCRTSNPCQPALTVDVEVTFASADSRPVRLWVNPGPDGPLAEVLGPDLRDRWFSPPYGCCLPFEATVEIDTMRVSDDRRTLTVEFEGGGCVPAYAPWVEGTGGELRVAIIAFARAEPLPSRIACILPAYRYTYHLGLSEPFTGSVVEDLSNGQTFDLPG